VLKVLRDVVEHFDDVDGPSARRLARQYEDVTVGAYAYDSKEVWIGGYEGVPLSRVEAWLGRVQVALVKALEATGREVPHDLDASRVVGDDDLDWPPERLRYGWWIPLVPEQEWPHEEMPKHLAKLMAERFRRMRARDPED